LRKRKCESEQIAIRITAKTNQLFDLGIALDYWLRDLAEVVRSTTIRKHLQDYKSTNKN